MNELESLKKKIKYRSSYRGTKEMDILLTKFINYVIDDLDYSELLKLDKFMNCKDEDIYNYYLGNNFTLDFDDKKILDLFKGFKM